MKTKKFLVIIICMVILLATQTLCACSDFAPNKTAPGFSGAEELTPEKIAGISRELTQTTAPEIKTTAPETDGMSETDKPGTVYWTESGTVYHADKNCSALKNSTNIISGTVKEAEAAGKYAACSKCKE